MRLRRSLKIASRVRTAKGISRSEISSGAHLAPSRNYDTETQSHYCLHWRTATWRRRRRILGQVTVQARAQVDAQLTHRLYPWISWCKSWALVYEDIRTKSVVRRPS